MTVADKGKRRFYLVAKPKFFGGYAIIKGFWNLSKAVAFVHENPKSVLFRQIEDNDFEQIDPIEETEAKKQ